MPISSRRCGMITKREAERLCKSFLGDNSPPKLPENFAFEVINPILISMQNDYGGFISLTDIKSFLLICLQYLGIP